MRVPALHRRARRRCARDGAEQLGTQWVETDKNEHLKLTSEDGSVPKNYVPNYKSRLVARGDEEIAEIRSDSPTCDMEVINIICSVAACKRWVIGVGDLENAYFNAEKLTRTLILRLPRGGLPDKTITNETHRLKANVPIYGTRDAGRGFWKKLRRVLTETAKLRENFILKAFYHYVDENGDLAAVLGSIVDDTIYAIRPDHKWIIDAISTELVFGKIEERTFRFCGREIVQDEDYNVKITCKQTTLKIGEVQIPSARAKTPEEKQMIREMKVNEILNE